MNPELYEKFNACLKNVERENKPITEETISYPDFKTLFLTGKTLNENVTNLMGREVKGIVRTGECSPHGYIMLVAGVIF